VAIRPFVFGEDVAQQVLDLLFEEVHISIFVGIGCIKDLVSIDLVGNLAGVV
jgi:hypothetical protein